MNLADRFVFVIDKPDSHTWQVIEKVQEKKPTIILHKKYEHESKKADGLQRSVYLDWLKNNCVNDWCLVLDTDEVMSDNWHEIIKYTQQSDLNVFDVRMRHLIWNLGMEDATLPIHRVPRRFFKISSTLGYPLVEHPILQGYDETGVIDDVTIWHSSITKGLLEEVRKYKKQCWKSNMHTPEMLKQWHELHIKGYLPAKFIDLKDLPTIVKNFFCLNENGETILYEKE